MPKLPKTGIEQNFMRHDFKFLRFDRNGNSEAEPIFEHESFGSKLMLLD